jgi:hypothetical protein
MVLGCSMPVELRWVVLGWRERPKSDRVSGLLVESLNASARKTFRSLAFNAVGHFHSEME